jgi:Domain of Unknown Function (DUF1080)
MKQLSLALLVIGALITPAFSKKESPLVGRWDLTIVSSKGTYPSWIEVSQKGGQSQVRIVGQVASAHPAHDVRLQGSHLTFASSEWFGHEIPVTWKMRLDGGKLKGTQARGDGVNGNLTGERAPALDRKPPSGWFEPEALFNGKDLSGWEADGPENHWKAENGELVNQSAGANIRTTRKFEDFKLHIEYNCPDRGNSGVYLRGRDEVQVEYEAGDANDKLHGMGSIYGFIAPAVEVPRRPGTWESYDITLVGRHVTVVRNGVTTIDNQEIPGITGGAIDSHEGEPGPLYIQGDHTGGMKYRNIRISLPKS